MRPHQRAGFVLNVDGEQYAAALFMDARATKTSMVGRRKGQSMRPARKRIRSRLHPSEQKHLDDLLDEALEESFPASDPIAIDVDKAEDTKNGAVSIGSGAQ